MRLRAALQGDLGNLLREELDEARGAVTRGVTRAADGLKEDWRRQVIAAGLSQRLANTIRSETYPKGRESRGAAGMVWVRPGKPGRWGSAVAILTNYNEGAVIRARNARALAVPTDNVPRKRGAAGRGRMSPVEVEAHFNRDLRYVHRPGRPGLLVMDELVASRSGRAFRGATTRQRASGRAVASVVMFILVSQVTIPRRLDLDRAARQWADQLPGLIVSEFPRR